MPNKQGSSDMKKSLYRVEVLKRISKTALRLYKKRKKMAKKGFAELDFVYCVANFSF